MGSSLQLKSDVLWLASLAVPGDLTYSTVADGGSESASWSMDLPRTFGHPLLAMGKVVRILDASLGIWQGVLGQPDFDEDQGWKFSAEGLFNQGEHYMCFDSGGNTTSKPNTAVDQAIARGLRWTRPNSLSSAAFGQADSTDALNTVNALLSAWGTSVGKRIRVDGDGAVGAFADPTVPDWHMVPGTGQIGLAEDDYASDLYLRYRPTASSYATVHVSDPAASVDNRREAGVDATGMGVATSSAVTDVGNGMVTKGKARYAWTTPLQPSRLQLTTPGGSPAHLPSVRGGQMVRLHGVRTSQGQPLTYFDFVIGRTEYNPETPDTIQIAPVQMASRTLTDVLSLIPGSS